MFNFIFRISAFSLYIMHCIDFLGLTILSFCTYLYVLSPLWDLLTQKAKKFAEAHSLPLV